MKDRGVYPWIYSFLVCHLCSFSFGQTVYSVSEETNTGTTVGNLAKDLHLDVRDLSARGFQLVSGPNERYFDVNIRTGILLTKERIDRDELCGESSKCTLELEAIASSPVSMYRIEINVLDINDNSPIFPTAVDYLNISEVALPGERFILPRAYDADVGSNSVKGYKLQNNEHFSLDAQNGEEDASPELVLTKALDREKQSTIPLTLTAFDGGKPAKSGTLKIVVNVEDINDNIPVFSKQLYKARVTENAPKGTSVISVHATDLDEGTNADLVYSFSARDNKHLDLFSIDPDSGLITVKGDIDHETDRAIEIRIQAKDRSSKPRAGLCKVLVEVIDINDNVPELSVTSLLSTMKEDATVGTMVGLITVKDDDAGSNGAVNLNILGSVPFKIENTYKNKYSLLLNGPLDRETVSQYGITIIARDEGTPSLSSSIVLTVDMADVNDNAPHFPDPVINVYVKENSPVGGVIYTASAVDLDVDDNAKISYSMLEGVKGSPAATSFVNINADSGEIYALQSFNFEEMKTFQFQIVAKDAGVPSLSSNATVHVFILDENDNSPSILLPYSQHGSVNSENIPYTAEAGYFVAKVRAVDADSGYNALLSYHISEPKGNNLFRIGTSSGEIRTKRKMSDNDIKTHPLVILVSDHGEPSLSATVSIDVVVAESSGDNQTPFRHVPRTTDDSFSALNFYLLIAIVSVSVIFLLSLITLIAVKCHKSDSSLSGYNPPMITTHPDGTWSYSKSTQQYDVCFSSDTLKSDMVVFPAPFPPADAELISINGGDTFNQTQTLPTREKVSPLHSDKLFPSLL
ncbi:protocadherin alpha-3-like [Engraulis encrasicolus]|uniref:protocadherin alpha-3-like n=1 Tax=Engraulis encrasicolus TaxID=184585 RepID=UPI002FD5FEC2